MDLSSMRPSSWNGVGAIAKVPAALWVSFVICASIFLVIPGHAKREPGISRFRVWSFGPSRNDELYALPPHGGYLNLRADFLISSSEKKISLAWVTISSAFHPVNGGVQPSISIIRISRTPRGPETPSTLPV